MGTGELLTSRAKETEQPDAQDFKWSAENDEKSGKGVLDGLEDVGDHSSEDVSSDSIKAVFDVQQFDPVLAKQMALVNRAVDEIGMTKSQWWI